VLRLISDKDFNDLVVRGLFRRVPEIDLVRAEDEGLDRAKDPDLLAWAAENDRIVVSHDRQSMIGFAYERVAQGLPMPGLFVVKQGVPIGELIEDLLILLLCSAEREWENQVVFIPF
jgi:hypothetical protein